MRKYIPNNLFALVLTMGSDLILCEIKKKIVAIWNFEIDIGRIHAKAH